MHTAFTNSRRFVLPIFVATSLAICVAGRLSAQNVPEELPLPASESLHSQAADDDRSASVSILESDAVDNPSVPAKAPPHPTPQSQTTESEDRVTLDSGRGVDVDGEEYTVLMQGPVHEAFAMPVEPSDENSVMVVRKAPPEPVIEEPPESAPRGNNVQWIAGYWAFDDQTNGYIWVSGLYRDVPPDRTWVPGNWVEVEGGFRWINGFWAAATVQQTTVYLPAPPAPIDNGPSTPAPTNDSFWLPGQWNYVDNGYRWQSGYWTAQYEDWIWQPACYLNTPQGYAYVSGYWDYEPTYRGVLYAPVYFRSALYRSPYYRFRPRYTLGRTASILLHLFVRPGYRNYYYGDYYGSQYTSLGYQPWYRSNSLPFSTASMRDYYQWKYSRSGIAFVDSMQRYDNYFRSTPSARPFSPPLSSSLGNPGITVPTALLGNSLDDIVRNTVAGQPAPRVSAKARISPALSASSINSAINRSLPRSVGPSGIFPNASTRKGLNTDSSLSRGVNPLPNNENFSRGIGRKTVTLDMLRSKSLDPRSLSPGSILRGDSRGPSRNPVPNSRTRSGESPRLSQQPNLFRNPTSSFGGNPLGTPGTRLDGTTRTPIGIENFNRGRRSFPTNEGLAPQTISPRSLLQPGTTLNPRSLSPSMNPGPRMSRNRGPDVLSPRSIPSPSLSTPRFSPGSFSPPSFSPRASGGGKNRSFNPGEMKSSWGKGAGPFDGSKSGGRGKK